MTTVFKRVGLLALSAALVVTSVALPANAAPRNDETEIAATIFKEVNNHRASEGLTRYKNSEALEIVSQNWAETMRRKGHEDKLNPDVDEQVPRNAADGADSVISFCIDASPTRTGELVVDELLSWSDQREAIEHSDWTHFGVGVAQNADTGCYNVSMIYAVFTGTPLAAPAEVVAAQNFFIDIDQHSKKGEYNYSQFGTEITWAGLNGVTTGWKTSEGQEFRPHEDMKRDAMAAFLYRQYGQGDSVDMSVLKDVKDVDASMPHAKAIAWMYEQGITTGYADGNFRRHWNVNRDALAAFLFRVNRMEGDSSTNNVSTSEAVSKFSDVSSNTQFVKEIAWMNNERVTTGYSDGTFRPFDPISRAAMITFIYRLNA